MTNRKPIFRDPWIMTATAALIVTTAAAIAFDDATGWLALQLISTILILHFVVIRRLDEICDHLEKLGHRQ